MNNEKSVSDGLIRKNLVLSSGLLTALCAVVCNKAIIAVIMSLALLFISVVSSVLTIVFFQKKNYYLQISACALISSVCYIPVYMLIENISSAYISDAGIYLPLIAVQSVLIYRTQRKYSEENSVFSSAARIFVFAAGAGIFMILLAIIREILAFGTLFGMAVTSHKILESAQQPWFAMIIIGICAAAARYSVLIKSKDGEE